MLEQNYYMFTDSASTPKKSPEPLPFLSPIISMSTSIYKGMLSGSMLWCSGSSSKAQPLKVLWLSHETWRMFRQRRNVAVPLSKCIVLGIRASHPPWAWGNWVPAPPRPSIKTYCSLSHLQRANSRVFAHPK